MIPFVTFELLLFLQSTMQFFCHTLNAKIIIKAISFMFACSSFINFKMIDFFVEMINLLVKETIAG